VNTLEWTENIDVKNQVVTFQLDTGAMCNVLPYQTLQNLGQATMLQPSSVPLTSYSGHKIIPKCKFKIKVFKVQFQVVDTTAKPILGASTCQLMGLVKRVHTVEMNTPHKQFKSDILKNYGDVFEGLGCMLGKHSIKVDPNIDPVVHAPRKVPLSLKDKVKAELDRMKKLGVIVKQEEPTPWVNSMVTVVKPNGKLRMCIDPRDLNKAIQREHYPMKTIEDVISQIPEAKVFSKLDATSGF